jgi:hypothetical protein
MSKLRADVRPQTATQSYGAYCWASLSDEYQTKFRARTTESLQLKVRRMDGYESLSRNDDMVAAAIRYLITQRCGQ